MQHSEQLPECRKDIDHLREMINNKLDLIIEQTTKTNGRVNKIEENGALFLWLGKNWKPLITVVFAFIGLFAIKITMK